MSSERSPATAPPASPADPPRPPAEPGRALTHTRPEAGQATTEARQGHTRTDHPGLGTRQARPEVGPTTTDTKPPRPETGHTTAETRARPETGDAADAMRRARPETGDAAGAIRRVLSFRNAMPVLMIAGLLEVGALSSPTTRPLDYVLVVVGSLALLVCRQAPRVALAVATGCMLLYSVRADPGPPATFPVLVAMFAAVATRHRLAAAAAAVAFLGGELATGLAAASGRATQPMLEGTVLLLGWFMAAGVAGIAASNWRAYLQQVEQRAADAERTREETALRRAGEERLRIARELHDSLTHSISIIKVQAGVAVHLARKRGEEVPHALLAIQEASGEAMRELRATLEVLRDDAGDPPGSGLDLLDDLVKRARDAGLPTTVTIDGERRPLPAEVDRAAYRIVQEALTNVARHAGPASASVRVGYGADSLLVQVDDDGRASPDAQPVPGVGLLGMRERVAALGGRLEAAPRSGGGFTVRADLPLPAAVRPASDPPASDPLTGHRLEHGRNTTGHTGKSPSAPLPAFEETA
ncbi:sensor histidine kinase [Nonomuraea indica]|uniref:sensor histidine kinase n=1 Tax=Nonomuraea indica TaxID=1581193 RepID=UPI001FEAB0EA|nr:sensor histidine kinase [Nonomuraea indica]